MCGLENMYIKKLYIYRKNIKIIFIFLKNINIKYVYLSQYSNFEKNQNIYQLLQRCKSYRPTYK